VGAFADAKVLSDFLNRQPAVWRGGHIHLWVLQGVFRMLYADAGSNDL
jgi:hypothetical protein